MTKKRSLDIKKKTMKIYRSSRIVAQEEKKRTETDLS